MHSLDDRPKLRWPLDVQPLSIEGQDCTLIRDNEGLSDSPAVIPSPLMPIVSRFDGRKSVRDIVEEGKAFGITAELVIQLADELERLQLLDTPETQQALQNIQQSFRDSPLREAAFAGSVYPKNPSELEKTLEEYLKNGTVLFSADTEDPIVAIACPHIDYHRGWESYAATYRILETIDVPDVIVLLGTAHQAGAGLFHLSNKHFDTPLGAFAPASDLINEVARAYGEKRSFQSEFLHRSEHSLELQLPFLAKRFQEHGLPMLIPILVGSFHPFVLDGRSPMQAAEVSDFVAALGDTLSRYHENAGNILFYSGVDFSHVGRHFGDAQTVSDGGLGEIERRDREMISHLENVDSEGLFSHIAEDHDRRRICGFPSLYTMFEVMADCGIESKGTTLDYRQSVNQESDCIVTFASAYWTESQTPERS